ncbi:MAG: hypothetical protein DDT34_01940 [Firmicutes bacterium]|nr:hypothetical protein [Bacillota bacterium]MBT9162434.1 hypothetical protein [Chloroflexota bacterium]
MAGRSRGSCFPLIPIGRATVIQNRAFACNWSNHLASAFVAIGGGLRPAVRQWDEMEF